MATTKYMCETCRAVYDVRDVAEACEGAHTEREAGAVIKGFKWQHHPQAPGEFPTVVRIAFSKNLGDYAVYRLHRYGSMLYADIKPAEIFK